MTWRYGTFRFAWTGAGGQLGVLARDGLANENAMHHLYMNSKPCRVVSFSFHKKLAER
jgi:hypothetical protein